MDNYKAVEQVFLHTPHRLVSTFSVLKAAPSLTSPSTSKAPSKPRTLCVTVSRRIGKPGFKASLHVLKKASDTGQSLQSSEFLYKIRKSYRLKHVVSLEAAKSSDDHPLCRLAFRVPGAARLKARKEFLWYECASQDVQRELLGVVYSFCRDHEGVVPRLVGLTRLDLGVYGEGEDESEHETDMEEDDRLAVTWSDRSTPGEVSRRPASVKTVKGPDMPAMSPSKAPVHAAIQQTVVIPVDATKRHVSRRTSSYRSMEAIRADILLDAVSDGASSLEDAFRKISLERQALDDANVHELLELSHVSKRIHNGVLGAITNLDELEDAFLGFDAKLRRLSKSISVVEESSSYLNRHRLTNAQDTKLDALINMTTLDPHVTHVLLETPISVKHMDRIRTACLKLHGSIEALECENQETKDVGIDKNFRAIRDAKQKMRNIQAQFIVKAVQYFDGELEKAVTGGGQHLYVQLHEKIAMMAPVLELLCAADVQVARERVVRYVAMTQELLVREARACVELIVQVQKGGTKVSGIGKEILKAETVLLENVGSGDAAERREVLSHIKGGEVSSAFANMASTLIPRVANEISVLADLLEKSNLQKHMESDYAAGAFVDAIEPCLLDCISAVKSSRGLALLDMTGTVSSSLRKLSMGSSLGRTCEKLSTMLHHVQEQSVAHWSAFAGEIHQAIQSRWREIRSRAASSDIHVLPFVVNFEYVAGRVESIVAEWAAKDGGISTATPNTSGTVRAMADDLYALLLPEIFRTIEVFSRDHEKHKDRIRMENYAFLRTGLQALGVKASSVLRQYSEDAARSRDGAVKLYVSNLMAQSLLFKPLAGFEQLVEGRELPDVFDDLSAFETALRFVSKSVERDLGNDSYLIRVVWDQVDGRIIQALDLLEDGETDIDVAGFRRVLAVAKLR